MRKAIGVPVHVWLTWVQTRVVVRSASILDLSRAELRQEQSRAILRHGTEFS